MSRNNDFARAFYILHVNPFTPKGSPFDEKNCMALDRVKSIKSLFGVRGLTRYAAKQNLPKFPVNTNIGKQMISFMAIDLWQELPYKFKDLNQFAFSKSVKNYILSQQYQM